MNIVIIGAGNIGLHLSRVFSQADYNIVLVDTNSYKLEQATRDLDVATRWGSGNDWELLEDLMELKPDLLIALTNDDEINLVACSIAKNLGYPRTIARIRKASYFEQGRINFEHLFCVDHIIGPEKLTAEGIANMILIPGSTAVEHFAHGSVQMRTMTIPKKWRKGDTPLREREKLSLPDALMVGLIERKMETKAKDKSYVSKGHLIFPHGDASLLPGDEVTFIGQREAISELHKFVGVTEKLPKSVMIVGGSLVGINLARILQNHKIRVTLLEKDFDKCKYLSETLPFSTVIHRDGTDYQFLRSEKVDQFDVFVATTTNDEVNFLAAVAAKDLNCERVIVSLSDTSYLPLITRLGIDHAASARIFAANRIFSIAREKSIASMVSMYENQAEIMEVKVSMDSKIAGIPIKQLGPELPKDFLIVVIQSRGRVFIADGTRVLSPGDTVIVISSPKHIEEIKKLF